MNGVSADMLRELNSRFESLLRGEGAGPVEVKEGMESDIAALAETINRFIVQFGEAEKFACALAAGNLEEQPPARNHLAASFKQLHASLKHLTWQTGQIAKGDYGQRVHFLGGFSEAFNSMVEALAEKERVESALRATRNRVRTLEGIIPICIFCKKIRDDRDSWQQLEIYISEHSEAEFSHGICPACFEVHYSEEANT